MSRRAAIRLGSCIRESESHRIRPAFFESSRHRHVVEQWGGCASVGGTRRLSLARSVLQCGTLVGPAPFCQPHPRARFPSRRHLLPNRRLSVLFVDDDDGIFCGNYSSARQKRGIVCRLVWRGSHQPSLRSPTSVVSYSSWRPNFVKATSEFPRRTCRETDPRPFHPK